MRIKKLKIFSSSVEQQYNFYCEKLSLNCIEKKVDSFTIQAGESLLEITSTKEVFTSKYHFAFNVEPSLIQEALDFLKDREIFIFENEQQQLIAFPDWNAKSIYFKDADGNILEFIARYNLSAEKYDHPFSITDVKNISEAGVPVEDTTIFIEILQQHTNIDVWKYYGPDFVPVGDEYGLFIVVRQPRDWFPTKISATQLPLELTIAQPGKNFEYGCMKFSFS
jgi:hypothetical protein